VPPPLHRRNIIAHSCGSDHCRHRNWKGREAAEAPPASQAAYAQHPALPLPPCTCPLPPPSDSTTLRRVEEGGRGNNQSTSQATPHTPLPTALPSPHRSQPPCCHRHQKRRGEWGGRSYRGLMPSRPPLCTPPFNTSIDQKPSRSPHNHHRRSQKGEGGATEAAGPPRLPLRHCHCHPT
jgi:hypothetical protein